MSTQTTAKWTIDDLGAQVALALSRDYAGQPNGQVSDIPNRRTIRYYTTIGLVDRPARMRGRTGLYGRRHLLQIVAVKRLQLRGLSLAEIQRTLAGATDKKLSDIAEIPVEVESPGEFPEEAGEATRLNEAFWRSAPASAGDDDLCGSLPDDRPQVDSAAAEPEPDRAAAALMTGIRISEAVVLLIEAGRPTYDDDIAAIEAAAAPLLKILHQRGIARR